MSNKSLDCRAAAAKCLAAVYAGASLSQQLPIFEPRVLERDRALYRQLCYGVLRFFPRLLGNSQALIKKPLKEKDSDVLMLVLLGGYQLTETRVPEHAAVAATVAATRALKKPWAKAFVNGVLRNWQRQRETLSESLTPAQLLAHPEWLHLALESAWPQQALAIEQANNQHPPMFLRINQQLTTIDNYQTLLQEAEIEAHPCAFSAQALRLQQPVAVNRLPGFERGLVSVQDEAAQLAAQLLSLAPGQRVLDACCAPGGKSCHILETEPDLTQLVALDIDQTRLKRVTENLDRLSLEAQLVEGDAAQTDSWWDGQAFDRILLDAPCSATGVIRRNPDIKLHRRASDIQALSELQGAILRALWSTLKAGGQLLYATCSVLPDENEKIIADFCQQHSDARHLPIDAPWGQPRDFGRQLFPQTDGHDGFFYCLIGKNADTE